MRPTVVLNCSSPSWDRLKQCTRIMPIILSNFSFFVLKACFTTNQFSCCDFVTDFVLHKISVIPRISVWRYRCIRCIKKKKKRMFVVSCNCSKGSVSTKIFLLKPEVNLITVRYALLIAVANFLLTRYRTGSLLLFVWEPFLGFRQIVASRRFRNARLRQKTWVILITGIAPRKVTTVGINHVLSAY